MNCKRGDYAFIVNAHSDSKDCIGRVVRCVSLTNDWRGLPCWKVHPVHDNWDEIFDGYLKPINGGRVEDAEVQDLYQPQPVKETT